MPKKLAARKHDHFTGRIGIARADITPPVGIYSRNWGAAKHDTADSIHRSLTLSALTLESDNEDGPLILVDGDLGWWRPLDLFKRFQKRILDEFSLKPSRFIFALSHTHSAAPLMDSEPELEGGELLKDWMDSVYETTVSTIRQALGNSFPGTLDWHAGQCNLAAVRDLPDPNSERFLCGFNPDREADNTLLVGRITDEAKSMRAVLVNYACHPTTLAWENTAISPDYPGAMRATIEEACGATAFFLLGACGDLAPRHQYVGDTSVPDQHGRQLGYAALATLNDMNAPSMNLEYIETVESGAPLAVWGYRPQKESTHLNAIDFEVELEIKDWPTADELEQQRLDCDDRALAERLRRKRDIRRSLGDGKTFSVSVSAWKIGNAVFVGSCGEAYSVLQQELRSRFPELTVICMNLTNGSIGYLPPAHLYNEDIYPVWQTPFAKGSLERMIDGMTEAIEQLLQPQSESGSPWTNQLEI